MAMEQRPRWVVGVYYYAAIVLGWSVLTLVYALLGSASFASDSLLPTALPIVCIIGLAVATGLSCFMFVATEEDWWDDFRDQNRLMAICAALWLGSLLGGCALGYTLSH